MAKATADAPAAPAKVESNVLHNHSNNQKHPHSYNVQQLGRDGKGEAHPVVKVVGCCDESEAIRAYCVSRGIGPSKHRFKAEKV